MEISQTPGDTFTTVHLNGRLDATTSAQVESALAAVFDSGSQNLIVDFTKLSYISSAGLRVLLSTAKKAKTANGKLALFGLSDEVKQIFDISGFTAILPIFPDAASAQTAVA